MNLNGSGGTSSFIAMKTSSISREMSALIVVVLGFSDGVLTSLGGKSDEFTEYVRRDTGNGNGVVHLPLYTVQKRGLGKRAGVVGAIGLGDAEDR